MNWRKLLVVFACAAFILSVSVIADTEETQSVYVSGDGSKKRIALTFDDGPHPKYTTEILDILDQYDVKATFFVIGTNAEGYPDIIKREIESGHEIGNHTYTHTRLPSMSDEKLTDELNSCERALETNGYTPYLFRPPEGRYDEGDLETITRFGYSVVLWSVDTEDWSGVSTDHIVNAVREGVKDGSIILCHDFLTNKCHTVEALKIVIPELIEEGYEFVTVSELLGIK
ncbi:MAG: polysaccharide deacetylase family protein [Clostridia bacterium]|nr:polysaccharide deacetylase family protein [Clostridia bacterium]